MEKREGSRRERRRHDKEESWRAGELETGMERGRERRERREMRERRRGRL